MLIAFNKPYGFLSQFNTNPNEEEQRTLKEFGFRPKCLPLVRLDMDSEGPLLFTDEKPIENRRLTAPYTSRPRDMALAH